MSPAAGLARRAAVEAVGTGALVMVVVGSGIQAARLTNDVGLQLLANSTATVLGLGILIAVLGPVSGAHFNPAVTLVARWSGRHSWSEGHTGSGRQAASREPLREPVAYIAAQVLGAGAGAVLANAMFGLPLMQLSARVRSGPSLWLAEVVATAGLILVVFGLARTGRESLAPAAVAAYIGAAYWFTSSTSFANPAVTLGRALSDTFAGIAPASVPAFVAAQLAGAGVGAVLVVVLFGRPSPRAGDVVVPHAAADAEPPASPAPSPPSDRTSQREVAR